MGITNLSRDYGIVPSIVRMVTTDTLSTAGKAGYITAQAANIIAINDGAFTWQTNDVVLVNAADGWNFYSISADFTSLNLIGSGVQQVSIPLTAAQINGMYAAPVFILAAPAAGTINLVQSAVLNVVYGSAQFASGGNIAIQYKNTVDGGGVLATGTVANTVLTGITANESILFVPPATIVSANAIAQPLYLSNASAPFTTGTGATATLNVLYRNLAIS